MSGSVLSKIKHIFLRNEVDYFRMFIEGSTISLKAAVALQTAMADAEINEEELHRIHELEHEGDSLVYRSLEILEEAFITPIDQEDLLEILKCIEEVTDHIDDVAGHCYMLDIRNSDRYIDALIQHIVSGCAQLVTLTEHLHEYKKPDLKAMNTLISDINRLESLADSVYQEAMRSLFTQSKEAVEIIRRQGIYSRLEDAMDTIEHAANAVHKLLIAKL